MGFIGLLLLPLTFALGAVAFLLRNFIPVTVLSLGLIGYLFMTDKLDMGKVNAMLDGRGVASQKVAQRTSESGGSGNGIYAFFAEKIALMTGGVKDNVSASFGAETEALGKALQPVRDLSVDKVAESFGLGDVAKSYKGKGEFDPDAALDAAASQLKNAR